MKQAIILAIFTLFLVGCAAKETPIPTETPTSIPTETITPQASATHTVVPPTATATQKPVSSTATQQLAENTDPLANYPDEGYGPVKFPDNINPLTGLPVDDPTLLDRRPIAVKISNEIREIRPQWGLSLADHVFEYYHEYGEVRYHAIFYGNDASEVGPIRSARFPDEQLVRAYKSVFAFASADYRVRVLLFNSDFGSRLATISDIPCPPTVEYPTCRIDPNQWNHLMTDTSILSQHFTENNVPNGRQYLDGLKFNKNTPSDGEIANNLIVRYSKSHYHKWEYDPNVGRYQRYDDASTDSGEGETFELLTDRYTDQPIMADNIVVIFAPYSFYSRDPEMINIDLVGFGKAVVFRDGQVFEVNWARITPEEIISLTYEDGSRFPMKPGTIWFDIIGETSPVTEQNSNWRFQFQTP
ncbi:MAG: DUF3048 domain-containing protein [Anaerolineales bacterium]|jgi:hypothetical protein